MSRRYGADPDWVLSGGGNTSFKDASTLWVKASGTSLATIDAGGFCAMDRAKLDAIWSKEYPAGTDAREAAALADLMAARLPGETGRPSVETLLHSFFPFAFVVHTHPSIVNGMTCGKEGEAACRELFGDESVWIPFVDPGYVLATTVKRAVDAFRERTGRVPALMFLQNHGLLVASDTREGVDGLSSRVLERLSGRMGRRPDRTLSAVASGPFAESLSHIASLAASGSFVLHRADADILSFAASHGAFAPLSSAFSPDHIVYAGHEFLYAQRPADIEASWGEYRARNGSDPHIAVVGGAGAFAFAANPGAAAAALALFLDACAVAVYAESFGGALHMSKESIDFIRNWEVERYRVKSGGGEAT